MSKVHQVNNEATALLKFAASVVPFHFAQPALGIWAGRKEEYIWARVSIMNTDCELEVEQDKRENSDQRCQAPTSWFIPVLEGESKWDCGVLVTAGGTIQRSVWVWMPPKRACVTSSQSVSHDFQQLVQSWRMSCGGSTELLLIHFICVFAHAKW